MPVGTKNSVIAGCGAHHIAVQARDWEASMKLYRDVLGMKIASEWRSGGGGRIALLDMGDGSHMELLEPNDNSPTPGSPTPNEPLNHIALTTTDTKTAIEHVRKAGYDVTVEPKTLVLGTITATIAFFNGPNGESIEFFQTH